MNQPPPKITFKKLNEKDLDSFQEVIRLLEEVFVQADKVDDYAINFYRSTAPTEEEQAVHFYYKLD